MKTFKLWIFKLVSVATILTLSSVAVYAEDYTLGESIEINNANYGNYKISVENAHEVDWQNSNDGTKIITIQAIAENIDFDWVDQGLNCYMISRTGIRVLDEDGIDLEFIDVSGPTDGEYEVAAKVAPSSTKRVSIPYYAPLTCQTVTVIINQDYSIEIPLTTASDADTADDSNDLMSQLEDLESRLESLESENADLKSQLETSSNDSAEGMYNNEVTSESDNSTLETMIRQTKESLDLAMSIFGEEIDESGNINVTDEFIENSVATYMMGYYGTITHSTVETYGSTIACMDWIPNNSMNETDFDSLLSLLNQYYNVNYEVASYENVSDECYVWMDYDNTCVVVAFYGNNNADVRWYWDPNYFADLNTPSDGSSIDGLADSEESNSEETEEDNIIIAPSTVISGTIVEATMSSIVIQDDEGETFTCNTEEAELELTNGILLGLNVDVTIENEESNEYGIFNALQIVEISESESVTETKTEPETETESETETEAENDAESEDSNQSDLNQETTEDYDLTVSGPDLYVEGIVTYTDGAVLILKDDDGDEYSFDIANASTELYEEDLIEGIYVGVVAYSKINNIGLRVATDVKEFKDSDLGLADESEISSSEEELEGQSENSISDIQLVGILTDWNDNEITLQAEDNVEYRINIEHAECIFLEEYGMFQGMSVLVTLESDTNTDGVYTAISLTELESLDDLSEESIESTPSEIETEPEAEIEDSVKVTENYEAGQYKVGTNLPAGEYVLFNNGSSSAYFCISSDANQKDIIQNGNFDYNMIVSLADDQYIELKRCYAVDLENVGSLNMSGSGMFKVGTFLSAGEYNLINDDSSAYYCIYSDIQNWTIKDNGNFSGNKYVEVNDGEYLLIKRGHIENPIILTTGAYTETAYNTEQDDDDDVITDMIATYATYVQGDSSTWNYFDENNKIPMPDSCLKGLNFWKLDSSVYAYKIADETADSMNGLLKAYSLVLMLDCDFSVTSQDSDIFELGIYSGDKVIGLITAGYDLTEGYYFMVGIV